MDFLCFYFPLFCIHWLMVKNILPNYGVGVRLEFKHNVNIRLDYGFGKETAGFVFQFAEAF